MASQALATRQQSSTPVARQANPYDGLRFQLDKRADDFKMALPGHITPEKFQRTVMTAAQQNMDLLKADRGSLITACMKAAQDGLLPDGREAALVTFNTRTKIDGQWKSVALVQYMPMVFGLRKKILQSGEISAIETNVVYRREVEEGAFIFEGGTEAMLRHRPMLDLSDDELHDDNIVAAYSVATMKDGTKSFEVMRRAEINKVRQTSKTGALGKEYQGKAIEPKGPWVDWFGEMSRKTVMRRHSKTLPMSGDLIDVEAQEDNLAARSATTLLGAVEGAEPQALPPSREEEHDPETGEIAGGREEEDEETARRLDAQTYAEREGRTDEQHGDQHDGTDDPHPAQATADDLIARAANASVKIDITNIRSDFAAHRDAMPEDMADAVEAAIDAASKRIG